MKQKMIVLMLAVLVVSCGSFNEGHAELHINKNISTGEIIAILDADISVDPEKLTEFFEIISPITPPYKTYAEIHKIN